MFSSRIHPEGQTRIWSAHGDRIPGVRPTPLPESDHEDAERLGRFARPTHRAEDFRDLLRPLEVPAAIVAPAGPKTVKRYFVAAHPSATPWPDPADVPDTHDFHVSLSPQVLEKARRL